MKRAGASPALVLGAVTAAQAASGYLMFAIAPIGPQIRSTYGLSLSALGIVLAAPFFGIALGAFPAGAALDRYGARRSMLVGCCLASVALVPAALVESAWVLVGSLAAAGAASAVIPISGIGAIFHAYAADRRGRAMGIRQMGGAMGGVAAAVLAPLAVAVGGMRLALLSVAFFLTATAVVFALVVEDDVRVRTVGGFAVRTIWRLPGFPNLLLLVSIFTVLLQSLFLFTVPAARGAGLTAFEAGAVYFVVQLVAVFCRLPWGWLADRQGGTRRERTMIEIAVVITIAAPLFALALHGGPVLACIAAGIFAFGAAGWNGIFILTLGELGPRELIGRAMAFSVSVSFIVQVAAAPGQGLLADHLGWDVFWGAMTVVALAGVFVAARGRRREPA